jgi:selenocysteine-specific translation elongation factor
MDLTDAEKNLRGMQERFPRIKIIPTSAAKGEGMTELKDTMAAIIPNDKDVVPKAI